MDGTAGKAKLIAQCFFKNKTIGKPFAHILEAVQTAKAFTPLSP
jgi:hypothetical protein